MLKKLLSILGPGQIQTLWSKKDQSYNPSADFQNYFLNLKVQRSQATKVSSSRDPELQSSKALIL